MKWMAIIIALTVAARYAFADKPSGLPKQAEQAAEKAKSVTAEKFKIKVEKKDKDGKKETREFPLMFDIADKARKAKAGKAEKQKEKKAK